jgi:biotin synthase
MDVRRKIKDMPEVETHEGHRGESVARAARGDSDPRWDVDDALTLFVLPFGDLIYEAQRVHRMHFDPNEVQLSTLLSIKTGGCPEDCGYCAQSARYQTSIAAEPLMASDSVLTQARAAKEAGATRFCMGAAWRELKDRDLPAVTAMVRAVKDLGLETCMTLGMLTAAQAAALRHAGLDYYNHNIDTSERHYGEIVTTRSFQDRLDTLAAARDAALKLCCGGILGLGEGRRDRADMLVTLANLAEPPESVPINMLIPMPGTPLEGAAAVDPFEFVRTIAVARILMPRAMVRLSAGREAMSDELQALAFLAGANSIFTGEKLLTAPNTEDGRDAKLFERLGLRGMPLD